MHAELFALQCFMEWVLKKKYGIQENYIWQIVEWERKLHNLLTMHSHRNLKLTYDTSHTQTVFSAVQQNALYVCVFSFFVHATEALLLARLQKLMPTETSVTCHMLQSVWQEKNNEITYK